MRRGCLISLACALAFAGGDGAASAAVGQDELEEIAAEAHARIAARIGVPFPMGIQVTISSEKSPPGEEDTLAYQDPVGTTDTTCRVVVTKLGVASTTAEAREIMLHEETHCLESLLNKGQAPVPGWVSEGGAAYVAATLGAEWNANKTNETSANFWSAYFDSASESLLVRKYTAMPFFVGLQNAGVDVLKLLPQMFAAQNPETQDYDIALNAALASSGDTFLRTLAPSIVRKPELGADWAIKGPSLPSGPKARMPVPVKTVSAGHPVSVTAPAYGSRGATIKAKGKGKVLIVEVSDDVAAKGLFHTADDDVLESGAYCLKGSCACPGGDDALRKLGPAGTLAIYGDRQAVSVKFHVSSKVKDGCPKSGTTLNISGAENTTMTRDGACSTYRLGDDDIQVIFFELIDGVSTQLTLELDTLGGPGAYEAPPSGVTLARNEHAYGTFVRNEPPTYPSSGVINVTSINAEGMKGTVSATMHAGDTEVSVVGAWTCHRP